MSVVLPSGSRIAIVGGGISGLVAARLLCADYRLTLLEAGERLGGHAHTVDCDLFGRRYAVDTGFMVFNERNYPNFTRLLEMLGVASRGSDMSFSVRCEASGWEYQGSSLSGLFAQRANLFNPAFYGMLYDIGRFNREALAVANSANASLTLGDLVAKAGYGSAFVDRYLVPMGAAIWSARPRQLLQFPARFILGFFENHGLLQASGHRAWRTILGGSRTYVEALSEPFRECVRIRTPVEAVRRHEDHVVVRTQNHGEERFDAVILATHADQSLAMLTDASDSERDILSAFPYAANVATLHHDSAQLPRERRAWAAWNYLVEDSPDPRPAVTYNLSRLQGHRSPEPICVTLNRPEAIEPSRRVNEFLYHHPQYSSRAIAAQQRHAEISGRRHTFYCGAYWGSGFHEDGVVSALAVGRMFGKRLESCLARSTKESSAIAVAARSNTDSRKLFF